MTTTTDRLNYPVRQSFEENVKEKKNFPEPNGHINDIGAAADFDLTQAGAEGDMAAFEEIYNRHHRRVYSLCLRMLQNAAEAEDLTQEVFIQLYRKIGSFRGDSAFTTWLHRMTVNRVLMHFRKRSVKFEKTTEAGETPVQTLPGTENPKRMPIVDKIALETAIAQLPSGYRSVFVLHDVEGYEHEEVAQILGCAAGTSKSQLHKARLKLRKLLKKQSSRYFTITQPRIAVIKETGK